MGQDKASLSVRPFSRSKKKQRSRHFSFQQQMTPYQNEDVSLTPTPPSSPSPPVATTSSTILSSITTVEAESTNNVSRTKIIRINTMTVFAVSIGQGCLALCLIAVAVISLFLIKDCKTEAALALCCAVAFFINGYLGVKNTRSPSKSKVESYIGFCIITSIIAVLMVGSCIYELGMFKQTSSSSFSSPSSWRYFLVAGMVLFWIEAILSLLGMRYMRKTFNDVPILNDNDGNVSGGMI